MHASAVAVDLAKDGLQFDVADSAWQGGGNSSTDPSAVRALALLLRADTARVGLLDVADRFACATLHATEESGWPQSARQS